MDREYKQSSASKLDANERQRFVGSVNMMIEKLEKANQSGAFSLKEAGEVIQAIAIVSQFVNNTLQQL